MRYKWLKILIRCGTISTDVLETRELGVFKRLSGACPWARATVLVCYADQTSTAIGSQRQDVGVQWHSDKFEEARSPRVTLR